MATSETLGPGQFGGQDRPGVEVIAGVNLPMLIRLDSARKNMDVREAVAAAREAGRKYISVASEVLEASR